MFENLHWLFPNPGIVAMSLGWIGVTWLASTLMNGQTAANKRGNAAKTMGLVLLLLSWVYAASYYAGIKPSPRAAILAFSGWLLFEIGDWLSYLTYILKLSPGGPGGWMWRKMALLFLSLHRYCAAAAERSLRPTERRLIEIHHEAKGVADNPKVSALAEGTTPAPAAPSTPLPTVTQEGS